MKMVNSFLPNGDMSDAQFQTIARLAHEEAGLVFRANKAPLVRARLARRMRTLKMTNFGDYFAFVTGAEGLDERRRMISSLTTNVSNFFRESHHFDLLRSDILPSLLDRARAGHRVRLWSAGCSNGQEAYSIAMTLADMEPDFGQLDIRILASDIDPEVIRRGRAGIYPTTMLPDVPEPYQKAFLLPVGDGHENSVEVDPTLRELVTFRELNLLQDWPMKGKFDVIFCRNVVIYFDGASQDMLWQRFCSVTADGGWLVVGHSEHLSDVARTDFRATGRTVYRRPEPQY